VSKKEAFSVILDGEVIRYRAPDGSELWSLPLSRVKVIGDMTNDHGPFGDDWFLCLSTGNVPWYEFPVYTEGFDKFAADLTSFLGTNGWPALAGSTDYASNVIWPPELAGKPMFKFVDDVPDNWFGRLMYKVFGAGSNKQYYSDEVQAYLTRAISTHA